MAKALLSVSVLINICLATYIIFMDSLSWRVESRRGVLTENVRAKLFAGDEELFVLPKGLTVEDASSVNQIDQFEPYRFSVIVTSDKQLVDYTQEGGNQHGNLYSSH